jgi:hypothetical protein
MICIKWIVVHCPILLKLKGITHFGCSTDQLIGIHLSSYSLGVLRKDLHHYDHDHFMRLTMKFFQTNQ